MNERNIYIYYPKGGVRVCSLLFKKMAHAEKNFYWGICVSKINRYSLMLVGSILCILKKKKPKINMVYLIV
uniref:Uncharacterized protein n=1 Tax=Lepeophtheirus salmonis TaxID=72036 RepID=A0A0K2TDT9_LEPSM